MWIFWLEKSWTSALSPPRSAMARHANCRIRDSTPMRKRFPDLGRFGLCDGVDQHHPPGFPQQLHMFPLYLYRLDSPSTPPHVGPTLNGSFWLEPCPCFRRTRNLPDLHVLVEGSCPVRWRRQSFWRRQQLRQRRRGGEL